MPQIDEAHSSSQSKDGKKMYDRMVNKKLHLDKQLELHRASGCQYVRVADAFPLLKKTPLPQSKAIPVSVHLVPLPASEKKKRKKALTLEPYVHRQMSARHATWQA